MLNLQIDLGSSGIKYEAGDAVGITPQNPPELVANLIKRLKVSAEEVFNVRPVDGSNKVRGGREEERGGS